MKHTQGVGCMITHINYLSFHQRFQGLSVWPHPGHCMRIHFPALAIEPPPKVLSCSQIAEVTASISGIFSRKDEERKRDGLMSPWAGKFLDNSSKAAW